MQSSDGTQWKTRRVVKDSGPNRMSLVNNNNGWQPNPDETRVAKAHIKGQKQGYRRSLLT